MGCCRPDGRCKPPAHPFGDFWLIPPGGKFVIVERKAVPDLEHTLVGGRLFKQFAGCREYAGPDGVVVLLIEGNLFAKQPKLAGITTARPGVHPNAIRGALLSLQEEYGVKIVPSNNGDDTVRTLIWLYDRYRVGGIRESTQRRSRSRSA